MCKITARPSVPPEKGSRCIDTRDHDQQRSDWLAARQEEKTPDEKLDIFLDLYKETAKRTKLHKCVCVYIYIYIYIYELCSVFNLFVIFYMIPNYVYL